MHEFDGPPIDWKTRSRKQRETDGWLPMTAPVVGVGLMPKTLQPALAAYVERLEALRPIKGSSLTVDDTIGGVISDLKHLIELTDARMPARWGHTGIDENGPGNWLPIETAPRDGHEILITNAGYGMLVRIGFFDEARGGIWSIWPGREHAMPSPSHWMPLPVCPGG